MATGFSNMNTLYDTIATGTTVVFNNGANGWGQSATSTNPAGTFAVMGSLDLDSCTINGLQNIEVKSGATITTGHAMGLNGAITATGTQTFSTSANYGYDGSVAQVTGTQLPATVHNLTIDNINGVALSQATTVNNRLILMAGVLNNSTNPVTLGPSGSVISGGGSLAVPLSGVSVESPVSKTIPQSFYMNQNYPNPFNPSTVITYGLPQAARVTATVYNLLGQEVATLFAGQQSAGEHQLSFNASRLGSGVYFYRIQAGNFVEVKRMLFVK
jgi:hypothetical protein